MIKDGPTVVHFLAESVRRFPDRQAMVYQGKSTTYAELWSAMTAFTQHIQSTGLTPGDRIAIVIPNSLEYVAASYGTMAARGVVVGLSAEAIAAENLRLIRHCGASMVILSDNYLEAPRLARELEETVRLLRVSEVACLKRTAALDRLPTRHELAAIVYTSGTTGAPKGVMISHGNLASNTESILSYLSLSPQDRVLCVLPFSYAYGSSVLHTHLAAGSSVVVEDGLLYPELAMRALIEQGVTGIAGVPWMLARLLNFRQFNSESIRTLRSVTQAGAPMPAATIDRLCERFPEMQFFAMYGQTEATARLTYLPPRDVRRKRGSVGVAIPGVTLEIRRDDGTRAVLNETGEVFATGPNIMEGYWNAPEATARVISCEPTGRWLRTGDMGRLDEDGYLYLVGRNTELIKTGAHRVSPLEIEEAVTQLKGVAEAVAFGISDPALGEAIVLAVVKEKHAGLDERTVLRHCRLNLSQHKIPRHILFLEGLPKTANGKPRRKDLNELIAQKLS